MKGIIALRQLRILRPSKWADSVLEEIIHKKKV